MEIKHMYRYPIRKETQMAALVAASAPVTLHILSTGRTCKLRKLHAYNGSAVSALLEIGTGLAGAFARTHPRILVLAGNDVELPEDLILGVEFSANITITTTAAVGAAPLDLQVRGEVDEYTGPSG